MENNKYREAMERVTTPPDLYEITREILVAETEKRKNIWKVGSYIALAAAFMLVIGAGLWALGRPGGWLGGGIFGRIGQETGAPSISAPGSQAPGFFESGSAESGTSAPGDDAVDDLELNFILISDDSPPIRMSNQYPLRREKSLSELPWVVPENAPSGFRLIDDIITEFFSEPSDTPNAVIGEVTYQTQSGELLTVVFTDMPIYLPVEIGSSFIHDVPVGVGHTEEDEKFYGAFEMYGLTYLLTAEGISRREFTQALIHFITSL